MNRKHLWGWLFALAAGGLSAAPAHAQSIDDLGLWTSFSAQGDLSELGYDNSRVRWWFDGHVRLLDDANGFNQSIVRPGVGWAVSERSTLWLGYGWIHTAPLSGPEFSEHRIWQQWTWGEGLGDWKFSLRSRFEQRLLDTGDDTGLRFRQQFRIQHNLPSMPHLTLVAWDELFYNLNNTDWGASGGFDQNRTFAGIGLKLCRESRWRTEVGYLNQVIENRTARDRSNHILSINLFRSR